LFFWGDFGAILGLLGWGVLAGHAKLFASRTEHLAARTELLAGKTYQNQPKPN